ncbi:MAG: glycosyltransferase [Deltaproteobacteria bacterium]|nr:glycosyltransferase [Deltaproteobacteria bacterium]
MVHFHTPRLVAEAVACLKDDLSSSGLCGLRVEWILVDNGSEPEDQELFQNLGLNRLDPGGNTGYGGGVNRGVAASTAPWLVVMNPDVLVLSGCLGALLAPLKAGTDVVGPRFYWDRELHLLLPPNEPRRRRWEIVASLGRRFPSTAGWARRSWRRHVRRHWKAEGLFPSFELSGALLAFSREAWGKVGPFDEAFPLYFEETDWLHRLRRAGGSACYVNEASAIHLYNRSASQEPRAAAWLAQSRQRFQRSHYGSWFAALTGLVERGATDLSGGAATATDGASLTLPGEEPLWIEISPTVMGFPAAAEQVDPRQQRIWTIPSAVRRDLSPGVCWVRVVTEGGGELEVHAVALP